MNGELSDLTVDWPNSNTLPALEAQIDIGELGLCLSPDGKLRAVANVIGIHTKEGRWGYGFRRVTLEFRLKFD